VQFSPDAFLVGVNTGKKISGKSHF
jgi:hypothetical protein